MVDSEGDTGWQSMLVYSKPDYPDAISPRFTLILSGWVARDMFLLDTLTGITWNLEEVLGVPVWVPIVNDPLLTTDEDDTDSNG